MYSRSLVHRILPTLIVLLCLTPMVSHATTITSVQANNTTIGRYERYQLTFNLTSVSPANYNPFRPEISGDTLSPPGVDTWADITTPSGKTVKAYGFWDVDFDYLGQIADHGQNWGKYDKFVPASAPHWHVRYAPAELGTYRVKLYAKDSSGTTSSGEYQFTCVSSNHKGFIKVASDGDRLVYSNGEPFIPMGASIKDETWMQNTYLPELKANGMNFVRRWLVNGNYGDIHRDLSPQTWTLSGSSYDSSVYRSGKRSVKKTVTGTGSCMELPFIGIRNGAYYKAAAWLRTSSDFNGTAAVRIMVRYTDGSSEYFTGTKIPGGRSWTQSVINFDTINGSKTADFASFKVEITSGSSGTVWIDDVELYQTNASGGVLVNYNYLWTPSFEEWNPSQLRLWAIWRAERLLSLGEQHGIAVQPCIFDYRLWHPSNPTGFYSKFFGDFWTDPAALAQQDRTLRYLAARFGSFRSVLAWELTNEGDPTYTTVRGDWIRDKVDVLKASDPQGHMITNSYWGSPGDIRFCQMPEMAINQVHFYINTEERKGGQGVPTWWTQPSGVVIERSSSNAHSGGSCMKFTANGSTVDEGQSCYLKPGKSYTVRYWLKTSGVGGSAGITLRFYAPDGSEVMSSKTISDSGSLSYTRREHTFTAPSSCARVYITLQLKGTGGTAYFDDIEVIDNATGRDVFYNGDFESPNFGDDEFDWGVYNTYLVRAISESGPNGTRKPWISGEFGLMGFNADLSGWADPTSNFPRHDSGGIHIHNCIWAQFMAGSANHTPHYWWVTNYILEYKLLGVWKGITTFASKLPFYERGDTIATSPYPAVVRAASSNSAIRVLGQKRSNSAYLWIQNRQYSWSRIIREGLSPSAASAEITIPGFQDGSYTVEWYNTETGALVTKEAKTVSGGQLKLSVSGMTKDVAAIVKSGSTGQQQASISATLSADKTHAKPTETVVYTLTYTNTGTAEARNVDLKLPVPANTTYVTGSASIGGTYDTATKSVSWKIASVAPGATGKVTASVKVN